jgi:hypothetical protein
LGFVRVTSQLEPAWHPVDNVKDRYKGRASRCLYFANVGKGHYRQLAGMTGDGGQVAVMQRVDRFQSPRAVDMGSRTSPPR